MVIAQRRDSERPARRSTLTGARDASAILFSLDVIRRAEAAAVRTPPEPVGESGIIDLQALAELSRSAPSRADRAPLIVSASAGLFATSAISLTPPLVVALVAKVASDPPPNFGPNRRKLFLSLGTGAFVVAAIVVFLSMRWPEAPVPAAIAVAAEPAPSPPTPSPPAPPIAAPTPSIAAVTPGERAPKLESTAPPASVAKAAWPRKSAAAPAARAEAKEPASKVETRPAAPVCDLTCQMERAVAAAK
ncbi:MAG: hypothetical protein ABJE95_22840 [Byssovorax sp.]